MVKKPYKSITYYKPSPGVMYTVEFAEAVPVKYAPGTNENTCVVLGNNGIAAPVVVTFAELLVAFAAATPTPRNTV
jgi:hypothetical protein